MSLIVLDIELTEKNIIRELGLYIGGFWQGFSFCPPKTCKPNKQTTWNTSHLHGIAWSSGKLDYDKLFAVFYYIKVKSAEVFAKGLQKCRLLTRLLGQIVEKLDDSDCPKIQDLVGEGKRTVRESALVTLSNTKKASLCQEESKGVWRMGYATFLNFVSVFCIVFTTKLILSSGQNFFYSIHFDELSLRNR